MSISIYSWFYILFEIFSEMLFIEKTNTKRQQNGLSPEFVRQNKQQDGT